jgi:hypothetical protein
MLLLLFSGAGGGVPEQPTVSTTGIAAIQVAVLTAASR